MEKLQLVNLEQTEITSGRYLSIKQRHIQMTRSSLQKRIRQSLLRLRKSWKISVKRLKQNAWSHIMHWNRR